MGSGVRRWNKVPGLLCGALSRARGPAERGRLDEGPRGLTTISPLLTVAFGGDFPEEGQKGQEGKTVDSVLTMCPWIMTSFSQGWKWRLRVMDDGDLHKRAPPVRSGAGSLPQMGFVPKHMSLCSPTFYSVPLLGGLCPIWGNWAVKDAGWISLEDEITKRGGVLFLVSVSKETLSFSEI